MHILLFIFYMVVLCYAITRMNFFRNSRIRPGVLLGLFILRVATGCLHNLVAYRYYPHHGDIWTIFQESFITRQELLSNFHSFLSDNSNWEYVQHNFHRIGPCPVQSFFVRQSLYQYPLL